MGGGVKGLPNILSMFNELITIENLFCAWYEFRKGKSNKPDVMWFELNLEDNIFQLYEDLITKNYFHQLYHTFYIWDPKFRIISKASVRDRVVHHLLYKYLEKIVYSYSTLGQSGKGVPIGNFTSQIFANIYMNELDYFAKFTLREKHYFRYADDFIFLHESKEHLEKLKDFICQFVSDKLKLTVHPNKIFLQKFNQGLDFLGYVLLRHHRVLRTNTKQQMFKKTKKKVEEFNEGLIFDFELDQTVQSYLGILTHCEWYKIKTKLQNEVWLNRICW